MYAPVQKLALKTCISAPKKMPHLWLKLIDSDKLKHYLLGLPVFPPSSDVLSMYAIVSLRFSIISSLQACRRMYTSVCHCSSPCFGLKASARCPFVSSKTLVTDSDSFEADGHIKLVGSYSLTNLVGIFLLF